MRKIKYLKSGSVMLAMILLCVFFSIKLHDKVDMNAEVCILYFLKQISVIIIFIDTLVIIAELLSGCLSKSFKSLLNDIAINAKQKVKRYSKKCDIENDWIFLSAMVSIYPSDKELVEDGLNYLLDAFNNLPSTQAGISYYFLKHRTNESIAPFLKKYSTFQSTCENVSESVIRDTLKNLYDFDSDSITIDTLHEISMGILHLSLPQNEIIEDAVVYTVRSVIDWMINNVDVKNVKNHKSEITATLVAILELYKRIESLQIKNKYLKKDMDRLKKSKWIKNLVREACLCFGKNNFYDKGNSKISEYIWLINILTAYPNYVGYIKRNDIYLHVNKMNSCLCRKYSSLSDDTCAILMFQTSVIRAFVDDAYIADTVSLMALTLDYSMNAIEKVGGKNEL